MSNISSNKIITVNRGDTFSFPFDIQLGKGFNKEQYHLEERDKVYLGVMEANQPFELAIIKKSFEQGDLNSDGTLTISFKPSDTLRLLPGNYYYSIKLVRWVDGHGKDIVTTLTPKTKFIIME